MALLLRIELGIQAIQQCGGHALHAPQLRAPGRLGGMGDEHRLDAEAAEQLQHLVERQTLCLDLRQRVLDAARLRLAAVGEEVLAATADAMRLLGKIHRLEPRGEGAHQVARQCRWPARDPRLQRQCALALVVTPLDGGAAVAFHQRVQFLAALFTQHFADHHAQLVHVLAQGQMLGRELDLMAVHGA